MTADRRSFLAASLLASAAVTARPPRAAGQETKNSKSANDEISCAVIGVNGRGSSHIGGFLGNERTVITHICDADEQVAYKRAEEVAAKQGRKPEVVVDMRRLFDVADLDVVSVATPNHWHALATIWAVQAGKHVYCEKPVSHNVSEGRRAVQAAEKYNKVVQTGTQSRSNTGMIEAIDFIHSGGIGEVDLVRGLCYKPRKSIGPIGNYDVPANVDYDLWSGPAPVLPVTRQQFHYDWHWQWPYGNGDLGNQGIHQMDVSRWALGVDRLSNNVMSLGGRFGYEDAGQTPNTQLILHDFGDKRIIFEVRGLETDPFKGTAVGLIVYGTEGMVVMPKYYTTAIVFDNDGNELKRFEGGDDQLHYDNFVDGVVAGDMSGLNASILEGHLSSALCHLGNISYLMGQPQNENDLRTAISKVERPEEFADSFERMIYHLHQNGLETSELPIVAGPMLAFNPESETFVDNPTADAMLTRDYRRPYIVPAEGEV